MESDSYATQEKISALTEMKDRQAEDAGYVLSFELSLDTKELHIVADEKGIEVLMREISFVAKNKDHNHLMTPEWAGSELTSKQQIEGAEIINKVTIIHL